jgi:hypothetical protein
MEPTSITIVAIQNPGDAEATIVNPQEIITPDDAIEKFGTQIEQGAFVSLTGRSINGNTIGVQILVADRSGASLYLQDNEFMQDEETAADVDNIGKVIASGYAPLPQLNTYTVFGSNDDGERFVNVCTAETPEEAAKQTKTAVLVDAGCESMVDIVIVLTGDHSDAEAVNP